MNCLLIASTAKEIKPFIDHYGQSFHEKHDIDILISGIGMTATTYYLCKQIKIKKYAFVIQAGVAGCFDSSLPLGTVVAVKQDTIADQSVVELKQLKTIFDLKLVPYHQHPYKKGWLINPYKDLLKRSGLQAVKGISINQISTSKQIINFYRQTFNATVESMEGAALHYVCLMENIPFLQIRSISNYIGERNKKKWDMKESILNLNRELMRIMNS